MAWSRLMAPEEIVRLGFRRSPVVMVNEAHDGLRRCLRTRKVGAQLVPVADAEGARHLAMEALWDREFVARANAERRLPPGSGYLGQAEMRDLVQSALDLGWTLVAYEADMSAAPGADLMSVEVTFWRELEQARNLEAALPDGPLLVWCGWGHLSKRGPSGGESMAQHFGHLTGVEPFCIDQTTTIGRERIEAEIWLDRFGDELAALGGTAGFLLENAPPGWRQRWADAFLLSLENDLV
jgi:hypothetical protein